MSKVTESSEKYLHLSFIIELRYGMDSHIIFTDVGCQTRSVVSSRLSQVTPFIAIAQLNFIKESTSYIHNTVLGISNTTFT